MDAKEMLAIEQINPTGKVETRTISETKIYYPSLCDIRKGPGSGDPVAVFDTLDKLRIWMGSQYGPWQDDDVPEGTKAYVKWYRKGTPLEWYEPPKHTEPSEDPWEGGSIGFQWCRDTFTFKIPYNPEPCTQ